MNHEKIIRRADGSRVKIVVNFSPRGYPKAESYHVYVMICEKGKRTWRDVADKDNYQYRRMTLDDRLAWEREKMLAHVSLEEIYQAKLENWEKYKPTI